MNISIKALFSDKIVRMSSFMNALLLLVLTILTIYFYFKLPPYIPLFNQLPWGMERLSLSYGIFYPLILAYVFYVINVLLASYMYEKMPLVSRMLLVTSALITLLMFIFIARTVDLVL